MLIQNIGNAVPVAQLTGHISSDGPRVVSSSPQVGVTQQPSESQLKGAVDSMNSAMRQAHQSLEFTIDAASHTTVIKMKDTETGQLISQFPSEAALAISHSIEQLQAGALLKQKA
jgi:flagellar protein FlaG